MGKILMLDRFKINQQKFSNSLGTLSYHHNLIIILNMVCEMLIDSSICCPKSWKKMKKRIKITSTMDAQVSNNQYLAIKNFKDYKFEVTLHVL